MPTWEKGTLILQDKLLLWFSGSTWSCDRNIADTKQHGLINVHQVQEGG